MKRLLDWLDGKKTYITAGAGMLVFGAWSLGLIDDETAKTLLGLLGFGGLAFLRAGVAKVEKRGDS